MTHHSITNSFSSVLAQHLIILILILIPRVPTATRLVRAQIRILTPLQSPQGQGRVNGIANTQKDFEVALIQNVRWGDVRYGTLSVSNYSGSKNFRVFQVCLRLEKFLSADNQHWNNVALK